MAIVQVMMVQRIFRFRINYRYLATLALFFAGVILFNVISRWVRIEWRFVSENHYWLVNFALMMIFSFGLAAMLRLLHIRSLIRILREDR
jgi:uncharacterized membrane protein